MRGLTVQQVEGKGRGIIACVDFEADSVVEWCPIILLPETTEPLIDATILHNYVFRWNNDFAIALGLGSLYNHSYQPNATYVKLYDKRLIEIRTFKPIKAGEEITVNYNGNPHCQDRVWFEAKD